MFMSLARSRHNYITGFEYCIREKLQKFMVRKGFPYSIPLVDLIKKDKMLEFGVKLIGLSPLKLQFATT